MAYPVLEIANEFIERGKKDDELIDLLKLQKLVYLAHGWNLAFRNEPLVRETVKAWKYGPVFPDLYDATKDHGRQPILDPLPSTSDAIKADVTAK